MADPGFARTVNAAASDIRTGVDYATSGAEIVRSSLGETLSDPQFWAAMAPSIGVIAAIGLGILVYRNWPATVALFREPGVLRDAIIALATAALLLTIYVYLLQPEIRIGANTRIDQMCPDRWVFNAKSGKCEPKYTTRCAAFSPKDPNLQTYSSQCDLALSCSTDWAGMCNT